MVSYYSLAAEREELVWQVCDRAKAQQEGDHQCKRCPAWEIIYSYHGPQDREKAMCRALAEETIAIVLQEFYENPHVQVELDDPMGERVENTGVATPKGSATVA